MHAAVGPGQMIRAITHTLFQPRNLPRWWVGFTEKYAAVPNLIAIAGLIWIALALVDFKGTIASQERGAFVETIGAVAGPGTVADHVYHFRQLYRSWFPEEVRAVVSQLYYNPALYLVVPFLLFLEFLFPANPSQPLIGKGFLQDAIWFVALAPIKVLVLFPIGAFIQGLFQGHGELIHAGVAAQWPVWARIAAAVLLGEFIFWLNHFIRHKIRVLWLFHAVHHSQKELNAFTEDRIHVVDTFLVSLLAFLPFFLFQVSNIYAVTFIALYLPLHDRFIHSNIKVNLGWLGWVVASPQFHRVHHSVAPDHLDKNFGGRLSVFDHLFGTACRVTNVYPETGIADAEFPVEEKLEVSRLPANWLKQLAYPFIQLFPRGQTAERGRVFMENVGARERRKVPHAVRD